MNKSQKYYEISEEDLRAALSEMKTYIDVTEEDLIKIYEIALKYAKERTALKISIRDVMTKDVITIKNDADVNDVIRLLSDNNISGLPVIGNENHVIGIVTEADILSMAGMKRGHTLKDILRHILGEPLPLRKTGSKAGDVMTSPAITTKAGVSIKEAAKIMDERRIKRLPVVDSKNKLIGIISRADIVRAIGK